MFRSLKLYPLLYPLGAESACFAVVRCGAMCDHVGVDLSDGKIPGIL